MRKKNTKDEFAMKIIELTKNMDKKAIDNLKAEKNVFEIVAGEFVVKAFYSFVE